LQVAGDAQVPDESGQAEEDAAQDEHADDQRLAVAIGAQQVTGGRGRGGLHGGASLRVE